VAHVLAAVVALQDAELVRKLGSSAPEERDEAERRLIELGRPSDRWPKHQGRAR